MCGIIGYLGKRPVKTVLLEGLRRLEYRGYDSAGVVFFTENNLFVERVKGKVLDLDERLANREVRGQAPGLGHTRWATHGEPSKENAHPHFDCTGEVAVVHNGIIENYHALKQELSARGHRFVSETDTEVIAHLVEEALRETGDLFSAVKGALSKVKGAYALGVIWRRDPETIVVARNQSPLVLGVGENEVFLASDVPAILPWTRRVIFLEDGDLAILRVEGPKIFRLTGEEITREVHEIAWDASQAEKAGFPHFMLKEIYEQPEAIRDTLRGRLNPETGEVDLSDAELSPEFFEGLERIFIVACGTSYHAGLVGKYLFEKWAGIPVEVDLASEFRYRDVLINDRTLAIFISQSGETADTLAGLRLAKELSARVLAICNVLGSTIAREAHRVIYTHAGPEIGVASTKAFTSQLTIFLLLTLYMGRLTGRLTLERAMELSGELVELPEKVNLVIKAVHPVLKELSEKYFRQEDFLYLGRNILYPVALEGALKLKEISYIHAEGYAAGEMKHGPIALIEENVPTVALAPKEGGITYEKMLSNIEEVRSRRGPVIGFGTEGDAHLANLVTDFVGLPEVSWEVSPILYTVPLQLLAYEIAVKRGCDVDQPRNLAKSVTVE
ncbi:glutamine--fructose-6-phosphate transaminase (isomerizing) [Thermosulfurimonas dismutans]|uniref:Glutamine--fructose-6-phosphate aminotransferase [isomerizing] n=1 Tax=Thermosulfurimonas dismutans TaxID=999894 RepID=A0A179D1I3_9BACT|nr:glutamine--fructose-6-phosphate transaminase (isomerizing) [Thermosulfurimonas dismutans]OAQ19916.1 Glucosamine--fructose-6-phosphate aminotransferase [isomerizing] [Thermosulfurimonas dismutans]